MKILAWYINPKGIKYMNINKYPCPIGIKKCEINIIDTQIVWTKDDTGPTLDQTWEVDGPPIFIISAYINQLNSGKKLKSLQKRVNNRDCSRSSVWYLTIETTSLKTTSVRSWHNYKWMWTCRLIYWRVAASCCPPELVCWAWQCQLARLRAISAVKPITQKLWFRLHEHKAFRSLMLILYITLGATS